MRNTDTTYTTNNTDILVFGTYGAGQLFGGYAYSCIRSDRDYAKINLQYFNRIIAPYFAALYRRDDNSIDEYRQVRMLSREIQEFFKCYNCTITAEQYNNIVKSRSTNKANARENKMIRRSVSLKAFQELISMIKNNYACNGEPKNVNAYFVDHSPLTCKTTDVLGDCKFINLVEPKGVKNKSKDKCKYKTFDFVEYLKRCARVVARDLYYREILNLSKTFSISISPSNTFYKKISTLHKFIETHAESKIKLLAKSNFKTVHMLTNPRSFYKYRIQK